ERVDVRGDLGGRELGWKRGGEDLVVRRLEDVGVDQRPTPDAAAGDDVQMLERMQLEETIDVQQEVVDAPAARPSNAAQELAEAAHAARKAAALGGRPAVSGGTPPWAALEHEHAQPALREPRGADRAAEAPADHDGGGRRHEAGRVRPRRRRPAWESECTRRSGAARARSRPAPGLPAAPAVSSRRGARP